MLYIHSVRFLGIGMCAVCIASTVVCLCSKRVGWTQGEEQWGGGGGGAVWFNSKVKLIKIIFINRGIEANPF